MEDFTQVPDAVESRPATRSRKWLWLLAVVPPLVIVLCGGLGTGIFFFIASGRKATRPYRMTLEQVRQDPTVIEKLGQPVEDVTWLPRVTMSTTNSSGTASLRFDVAGPKGEAHVYTEARMIDGRWGLTLLELTVPGEGRISLETRSEEGPSEAPAWSPGSAEEDGSATSQPLPPPTQVDVHLPPGLDLDLPDVPQGAK